MQLETTNTIEKDVIIVTTKTVEKLLSESPDSLALYLFYIKNAKIQETNSIWNTNTFGMKGLGWGTKRYNDAKKVLVDNGFLEETVRRNNKGQIEKHYLKINYIFGRETTKDIIKEKEEINHNAPNPQVDTTTNGFQETNALSNKSINALSNKNEITLPLTRGNTPLKRVDSIYGSLFQSKYGFYPTTATIGSRLKTIKELLKSFTELQLALLFIVFFNWKGMNDSNEKEQAYLQSKTHALPIFKFNNSQYEAYVRNVAGYSKEFDESGEELLNIVGENITKLLAK